MRFVPTVAPAAEPVSLAEMKGHLIVEHDLDDGLISACQLAARQWIENATRRALVTQTFAGYDDCFPAGAALQLGRGTLQSVSEVRYFDASGVDAVLDPSTYHVDAVRIPGRLALVQGKTWPTTDGRPNAVKVTFIAGFGDAADVPEPLKAAIKLLAAHLYAHREPEITGTIVSPLKFAVDALIAPYRIPSFA